MVVVYEASFRSHSLNERSTNYVLSGDTPTGTESHRRFKDLLDRARPMLCPECRNAQEAADHG